MPTPLPVSTDFAGSAVTEGGFKTAISNQRAFLAGLLGTTGGVDAALATLGALGGQSAAKTTAYTVVAADRGKVIDCNGTFTLTLTAAATLGAGFSFIVVNTGSGTITIDPNASELINGAATETVTAGNWAIVTCNGTSFRSLESVAPAAADPSMTLLGTLTTTSGTTQTLGSLNLTNYRYLYIDINGVSFTTGVITMTLGGVACASPTTGASGPANTQKGIVLVDLDSGLVQWSAAGSAIANPSCGASVSSYNNASTSIQFAGGTFDAGTIKVYGVK